MLLGKELNTPDFSLCSMVIRKMTKWELDNGNGERRSPPTTSQISGLPLAFTSIMLREREMSTPRMTQDKIPTPTFEGNTTHSVLNIPQPYMQKI